MPNCGFTIRRLRNAKGLGLNELARKAKVSAAFLSRVERGREKPPGEKKLRVLAKILDCESDLLLGIAGRIPPDVMRVIQKHPCEYMALIRRMKTLTAEEVREVQKKVEAWCEAKAV